MEASFCDHCGSNEGDAGGGAFKFCSGCREARYCSVACQKTHWKAGHKVKCRGNAGAAAPAPPTAVAAPPASTSGGGGAGGKVVNVGGGAGGKVVNVGGLLACAEATKALGTAAFQARRFGEAAALYEKALTQLPDLLAGAAAVDAGAHQRLRLACLLNASLCHLQHVPAAPALAAAHATAALALEPDSAKALLRRGRAQLALGELNRARRDLLRAQGATGGAGADRSVAGALAELAQLEAAAAREHSSCCPICLESPLVDPLSMACGHAFCAGCVAGMRAHGISNTLLCPVCRGPLPEPRRLEVAWKQMLVQVGAWSMARQLQNSPYIHELPPRVKKALRDAVELLRMSIALEPGNSEAYYSLGYAQRTLGDTDSAFGAFQRSIELEPQRDSGAHLAMGMIHRERGNLGGALHHLESATKLCPGDHEVAAAFRELGDTHKLMGEAPAAARAFRKSLAINHDQHQVHLELAALHFYKLGDHASARRAFRDSIKTNPGDSKASKGELTLARVQLGELEAKDGNLRDAKRALRDALDQCPPALHPKFVMAHHNLAQVLMQLGELEDAKRELVALLAVVPGHQASVTMMAQVQAYLRMPAAQQAAAMAADFAPRPPTDACAVCGATHDLLVCSKCKKARYCSREHQKQHWGEGHKKQCKILRDEVVMHA